MNTAIWRTRRWHCLAIGVVILVMANLAATHGGRVDEPWPILLPGESAAVDPDVLLLQQRASVSLEKLVRLAAAPAQPL